MCCEGDGCQYVNLWVSEWAGSIREVLGLWKGKKVSCTYPNPSAKTAQMAIFWRMGRRIFCTMIMGRMQARKSWSVLMVLMTMMETSSSRHLNLFALTHALLERYQYAFTGEQVKRMMKIDMMPYDATGMIVGWGLDSQHV